MGLAEELARILGDQQRAGQEFPPARVEARNQDGTLQLAPLDGTCEIRGGTGGAAVGEVVRLPGELQTRGGSGLPAVFGLGSLPILWIESLDPASYEAGGTYTVTALGAGLAEGLTVRYLLPDGETNPDIQVEDLIVHDPNTATWQAVVAAEAVELEGAPLGYGAREPEDPADPLPKLLEEAYGVTPTEDSRSPYWAFARQGTTARAWAMRDEEYVEDRGSVSISGLLWASRSPVLIPDDPEATVGAGSLAWLSGSNLVVWDVAGSLLHTRAFTALSSHPLWWGGYLWWVESPLTDTAMVSTFALWRSRADFSAAELVSSADVNVEGLPVAWSQDQQIFMVNNGATIHALRTCVETINDEGLFLWAVSLPTLVGAGGTEQEITFRGISADPPVGIPSGPEAFGADPQGHLLVHDLAPETLWVDRWPTTSEWVTTQGLNVGLAANGDRTLYGLRGGGILAKRWLLRAAASGGALQLEIEISNHPMFGIRPDLIYPGD